jgi:hypothetical protein
MSESMNRRCLNVRWKLMTTASVLAFGASICGADAADTDQPTLWIELGAQIEQVRGFGDPYLPPFSSEIAADGFTSLRKAGSALGKSFGENAAISFQPENSLWDFSASVRYGRASGGAAKHEQTPFAPHFVSFKTSSGIVHTGTFSPLHKTAKFSETRVKNSESHAIVDFQAGRDFGLGLFSSGGRSEVGFGVRFAQFSSKQVFNVNADPDFYFPLDVFHDAKYHHTYAVTSHAERSFHGLGPSLSWNASAPVIGDINNGGITLDWGLNAALLFGRQKTIGHHQTIGTFYKSNEVQKYHFTSHIHRSGSPDRSHSIIAPNIGGFAGISFLYSSAKVSLGYRADLFFGAIDGGIDTRKTENIGFYGPFATISVGIGD